MKRNIAEASTTTESARVEGRILHPQTALQAVGQLVSIDLGVVCLPPLLCAVLVGADVIFLILKAAVIRVLQAVRLVGAIAGAIVEFAGAERGSRRSTIGKGGAGASRAGAQGRTSRRRVGAIDGSSVGDCGIAVATAGNTGVESELVVTHGVAGLGVHEVGHLHVTAAGRRGAARVCIWVILGVTAGLGGAA